VFSKSSKVCHIIQDPAPSSFPKHADQATFTGVKKFDVSLDTQTATIETEPSLDYETVLEKIKKTGKKVNSGEADGKAMTV
jgi:hypothetical protein